MRHLLFEACASGMHQHILNKHARFYSFSSTLYIKEHAWNSVKHAFGAHSVTTLLETHIYIYISCSWTLTLKFAWQCKAPNVVYIYILNIHMLYKESVTNSSNPFYIYIGRINFHTLYRTTFELKTT